MFIHHHNSLIKVDYIYRFIDKKTESQLERFISFSKVENKYIYRMLQLQFPVRQCLFQELAPLQHIRHTLTTMWAGIVCILILLQIKIN